MELKQRTATGLKWSTAAQGSRQGLQLLTSLVLARLLDPSDFGVLGMAMVVIGFAMLFRDMGLASAVIQKETLTEEMLSTVFWINLGVGVLITALIYLGAPLIAAFFDEPRLVPVLQILSLSFFFASASALQLTLLERELAFEKVARIEIASVVAGSVLGITIALKGGGVYSLVFQALGTMCLTAVLLWMLNPWRPRFMFRWSVVREIGSYSLNLTGFGIVNYIARNADLMLVGRYMGSEALGYYYFSYRMMLFPLQNLSAAVGRVIFPVYSRMQSDKERFRRAFLKTSATVALVAFPVLFGIVAVARPFIFALKADWAPVIQLITILAPMCMIASIVMNVGSIYKAMGRTDWMFRWTLVGSTVRVAAIAIGLRWGIVGVAAGYTIAVALLAYPTLAIPFRLIHLRMRPLFRVLWRPFLSGLIMYVVVRVVENALYGHVRFGVNLGISIVTGVGAFLLISLLINREQLMEFLRALRPRASSEV